MERKRMKTKYLMSTLIVAASLATAAFTVAGCKKADEQQQAKKYTCTHHPEVVQDAPGTCPKCNMALVEKK
jgi:membrane fusion protein, copper/silver efflux system